MTVPAAPPAELARLAAENALLRQAIERLPLGLSVFDGDDCLLLANGRYREIWSLPEELVQPGTPYARILAASPGMETDRSRSQPWPGAGAVGTRRREWALDDGRCIEIVVTRAADGSVVALHDDVTQLRQSEQRIAFLARHDQLTGLPHRQVLAEELRRALSRVGRGEDLALLSLDLDRFKPVNDTYGHPIGDAVLVEVARRVRAAARQIDLVVRLGGDEFAVLQCGTPQPASSTALARRLIDTLSAPFEVDGHTLYIGTSIGIAVAPVDGEDGATLMRNADMALFRAKTDGRGLLRYFEPEMDQRMQARRGLEADLRLALERAEFMLAYQPQLDTQARRVSGVEALLRWQHPQRGLVSPADFIPLAEETGLIVPIGRWVLQQACQDAMRWPAHVRVAVNVSAVQFRHPGLLQDVEAALAASGLPPGRLELEITESVMLDESQQALSTLHRLRERGIGIALDDFGTGYSSLSYLRSFPFDRIKIDRSFVRDAHQRPDSLAIIAAVVTMAASLGMQVTAEGIERTEQLHAVQRQGCREAQGFLFSRPRPAGELPGLIERLAAETWH